MKIQTDEVILTLSGKPYQSDNEDVTVGKALANILALDQSGGKMKLNILARAFYEKPEVELDAADLALVKRAVEDTKLYNNLINGHILTILEK